jgi:hypothetical protein
MVVLLAMLAACGLDKGAFDESRKGLEGEVPDEEAPPNGGSSGSSDDECSATVCFDVHIEKDISFLAVHATPCDGGEIDVSVSAIQEDGSLVPLDKEATTVGNGYDCDGTLDSSDIKVEGIDTPHAQVCVTFTGSATPGDVTVTAKAGQECHVTGPSGGSCSPCGGEGTGGAGATGGSGGCGDDGGCGGDDSGSGGCGDDGGCGGDDTGSGGCDDGGCDGGCDDPCDSCDSCDDPCDSCDSCDDPCDSCGGCDAPS